MVQISSINIAFFLWPFDFVAGEAEPKEQLQDVEDQDVS